MRIRIECDALELDEFYHDGIVTKWMYMETMDYNINQLSKHKHDDISEWAIENDVTLKAYRKLMDIFDSVDIGD